MIIWDCEGTGLIKPLTVPLDQQPEVIEFAAVKLDDETLEEFDSVEFLIHPTILWPLPAEVTKWTGITTEMLEPELTFARRVSEIAEFVLGERTWVAHNINYDLGLLQCELIRLGMVNRFPWPPVALCTVELTMDLETTRQRSDRLKLGDLYKLATGEEQKEAHRAMADVQTLATCVRWLRAKDGRI